MGMGMGRNKALKHTTMRYDTGECVWEDGSAFFFLLR